MGFTGWIVVAKAEVPLSELAALSGLVVLHESSLSGGWRTAQLDGDAHRALRALVEETQMPAASAVIFDSDLGEITGLTPTGTRWNAYLNESATLGAGAPPLEHPLDEVIRRAAAWSAEARLTSSEEALREALTSHYTFVEEAFDEVVAGLGIADDPIELGADE